MLRDAINALRATGRKLFNLENALPTAGTEWPVKEFYVDSYRAPPGIIIDSAKAVRYVDDHFDNLYARQNEIKVRQKGIFGRDPFASAGGSVLDVDDSPLAWKPFSFADNTDANGDTTASTVISAVSGKKIQLGWITVHINQAAAGAGYISIDDGDVSPTLMHRVGGGSGGHLICSNAIQDTANKNVRSTAADLLASSWYFINGVYREVA